MNDLDPTQTEAVRRALAAARHDEPIPAEVAARLDATLADLVAEESDPAVAAAMVAPSDEGATIIPLRRRRLPVLLAAAAAVVAAAVAVPQLIDRTGGENHGLAARDEVPATTSESAEAGDSKVRGPVTAQDFGNTLSKAGVTQLRDETLVHDVAQLLVEQRRTALDALPEGYDNRGGSDDDLVGPVDGAVPDASKADTPLNATGTGPWVAAAARGCGPSEPPAGSQIFAARYEGHRAIVVAFAATPDGTPVHVYDCRTAPRVPTRLFTLPLAD